MIRELQPDAWERLAALRARLPHALLLHGAEGVGKLQLAETFAQLLLCEVAGQGTAPCGSCASCRWFQGGNHPDVRYLEPEALGRYAAQEDESDAAPEKSRAPRSRSSKCARCRISSMLGRIAVAVGSLSCIRPRT
jgi:DNA polymerase III subunit delta'